MQFFSLRRARNSFGFSTLLILAAALFAFAAASSTASAQVLVSVSVAPPALPVYAQPVCPGPGYLWTPGYWAYTDDGGYYWVPGTWVEPPEVGFLWTPGYWGWNNNVYVWNAGYWGPEVGFYGGINYGFGYTGFGYAGGYWRDRQFYYNSRVNNVNVHIIHNVYQKNVVVHETRVSYNGGHGGISARPTAEQEKFAHERHVERTSAQEQHANAARADRNQFASVNHGRPAVSATPKPGDFKGAHVVPAKASSSERLNNSRTENKSRTESKTEAKPRTESRPATTHESKPETKPRTESKPATLHTNRRPKRNHAPNHARQQRTSLSPNPSRARSRSRRQLMSRKPSPGREPNQNQQRLVSQNPKRSRARSRDRRPPTSPSPKPSPVRNRAPHPHTSPSRQPRTNPGLRLNTTSPLRTRKNRSANWLFVRARLKSCRSSLRNRSGFSG